MSPYGVLCFQSLGPPPSGQHPDSGVTFAPPPPMLAWLLVLPPSVAQVIWSSPQTWVECISSRLHSRASHGSNVVSEACPPAIVSLLSSCHRSARALDLGRVAPARI